MACLKDALKARARELGFELAGIARAAPADDFRHLRHWLDRGHGGEMAYLNRQAEARRHPQSILPDVRSVVMVGLNYHCSSRGMNEVNAAGPARIATYALGDDYHDVLRAKLNLLLSWVQAEVPGVQGRGVVDTAPLLERDFARRAGLGWIGKNTMLINKRLGSFFFLGALLLDLDLDPDAPFSADHCGTCTRCLDACPTDAFVAPHQLDARRCIRYLTIELRGPVPEDSRPGMGEWLFGCDICQDVCPWNRKAPLGIEAGLRPRADLLALDVVESLQLNDAEFRARFRGTALWRTKRRGLVRNAAIVAGNTGERRAVPALERLLGDADPVVAEAAQWALRRLKP
jgi:epoxyqueuosine reductase